MMGPVSAGGRAAATGIASRQRSRGIGEPCERIDEAVGDRGERRWIAPVNAGGVIRGRGLALQSGRVCQIHRIVVGIAIEIWPAGNRDLIRLHEPPEPRVIRARLVVIEPDLGEPHLPRVLKTPLVPGTERAVGVD
jgi:hypothetical protein